MGCYDTLIIPCLFCKKDVEEQTKSGPCLLKYFRFDDPDLPIWVMEDFNGIEIECYNCGRSFRVVFDFEVNIIVHSRKLEPTNNLDFLELKAEEKSEGNT